MKKIIITLTLLFISNVLVLSQWGPKIRLELINDASQTSRLFLGVDTLATDGWDKDTVFNYKDSELDTTLKEDVDLPPPPMYQMYCRLIKDSNDAMGSYSYVDFRSIPPDADKFYHKYWLNIVWYSTVFPKINIKWGKLPDGIDSAKIHCYEWWDDDSTVDMRAFEGMELPNEAYKNCFIYVWYNKKHTGIAEQDFIETIFPNPAGNYINIINEDGEKYSIINNNGIKIKSGYLNKQTTNNIDLQNFPIGNYYMLLNNKKAIPFIKK